MYCPNCGKTNSPEQRFCRSCGLGLEKIVQSMAEQLPREELDKHLQDRKRAVDRWLNIIGGTAVSILVVSVLWGIIYKIIIVKGDVLEGSIFLGFILAIILFALLAFYGDSLLKASTKGQMGRSSMPHADDTSELPPELSTGSISSVTEHTTELLMAEKQGAERQG